MERYIQQLIEDMRLAADNTPKPGELWDSVDMDNPAEVDDMAYVEQYIYGPSQKLSEIVGIERVQLPPLNRLSGSQVEALYAEMIHLLQSYNFVPDFPEGLPLDIRYRALHENWDSEQVFVGAGEVHIEFCQYEPLDCPFPEAYCACRKIDEEAEEENRNYEDDNDESWPF